MAVNHVRHRGAAAVVGAPRRPLWMAMMSTSSSSSSSGGGGCFGSSRGVGAAAVRHTHTQARGHAGGTHTPPYVDKVPAGNRGGHMEYAVYGSPALPPVILLHGGGQNRHAWDKTARTLVKAQYSVWCVDLKGHGGSYWDPEAAYAVESFGQDLDRFLELTGLEKRKACMIGASLGGLTILQSKVALNPATASGIVLVDIAPRMELAGVSRVISFMSETTKAGFQTLEEAAAAIAKYQPHRNRATGSGGSGGSGGGGGLESLAKVLRKGPDGRYHWHWDPAFLTFGRQQSVTGEMSQYTDELEAERRRFMAGAMQIKVPCLLLRGMQSDLVSPEGAKEFLTAVPHASFVDIRDAHHMIAGDRNDVFCAEILAFLQTLKAQVHSAL